MSGNTSVRAHLPSREEIQDFYERVIAACEVCRGRDHAAPEFEPCELCGSLIETTVFDFSEKAKMAMGIISACPSCRQRVFTVAKASGAPPLCDDLCDLCTGRIVALYVDGMN